MLRKIYSTLLLVLISASFAFAQNGNGKLKGKITDKATGEDIPFASVKVYKDGILKTGVESEMDGSYIVSALEPGTYDVEVEAFGYVTIKQTGIPVKADKIAFADFNMSAGEAGGETLDVVEVIHYKVPLIDKDGGASGGTVTREDIAKMPGRSAASIAATVGGVGTDANGSITSVRGARSDATYYYIDGIKVRGSTGLPKSAIQEVSVVTGGLPANYGDATGGVISITTRGPSSFYYGGIDYLTSGFKFGDKTYGLDHYAYNLLEGSISGPLLMKKDSTGEKTEPIVGFFLSANATSIVDDRPFAIPHYKLKDSKREELIANPLRPAPGGEGVFYNTDFLTKDDFERVKFRQNIARKGLTLAGKLDFNAGSNINLAFGGSLDWNRRNSGNWSGSLFNYDNYPQVSTLSWRAYGRFTQRFANPARGEDGASKPGGVKNIYYTVMVDYSKFRRQTEDNTHGDRIFNYGYIGKFDVHTVNSYDVESGTDSDGDPFTRTHNGWRDTLVTFTPDAANSELAAITTQYYNLFDNARGRYQNLVQIQENNALINGQLPRSVYPVNGRATWVNIGTQYNGFGITDNSQFRVTAMGSADIGDHALSLGFEFEQRTDRFFSVSPVGLWTIMHQFANGHIQEIDKNNVTVSQVGSFTSYDYGRLNAAPGKYKGSDAQSFFDYNLRNALGYNPDGTDFINIHGLDPSTFSLDFFSADELLNQGNSYVSYAGYDHTGKKLKSKPSFNDFFNEQDEFGNFTRRVGAFEPIYTAAYIMDKFAFEDLIFNVGLRVDRFDANQQVLKDPYSLYPTQTVAESRSQFSHPSSVPDNAVVYVNDVENPTSVNGYRLENQWYNSEGTPITDPSLISTGSGIAPLLDPSVTVGEPVSEKAFVDYKPRITVMPRVAFSFPISDEALFFAHYDVLSKRPTTGNRLDPFSYFYLQTGNVGVVSNPDLAPEKTIDYELGFQQVLSRASSLKISAFYREMRDQVAIIARTGAYPATYNTYGNIDFGTVKGLTVAYDLRKTGNLWMRASYTLQFAEGTGSNASTSFNLVNSGQPNLRTIFPLSYDQRHVIQATVDYRFGEGKDYNGPMIGETQILKNTGANFVANVGSGTPYSGQQIITSEAVGNTGSLKGTPNGARRPWQFRIDAQFDKNITLKFGKNDEGEAKKTANMNIYLLITNLFNTKNITNVYRATGNADDDGYLNAAQYQEQISLANSEDTFRYLYSLRSNNPFNYSIPRTIRLGVKLDF